MGLNLQGSYFAIGDILKPHVLLDKWLNPYCFSRNISLRGHSMDVLWTNRANEALKQRQHPILIEMQIYFSCMIKKRVLFHEQFDSERQDEDIVCTNDNMRILFRAVQASSCDPVEFAENYPVKQALKTIPANKMHPSSLNVDFKNNVWSGEFCI